MKLLIIGSLDGQAGLATRIAMDRGAKVAHAENIAIALNHLRSAQGADLIMMDVSADIAHFMTSLRNDHISIPIVACGIRADADAAVRAIRAGAKEYVPLPPDPELIAAVFEAVTADAHALIFADPAMDAIVALADQVAGSDASILLTGESGTGKEVFAHHIHRRSHRADAAFISLNCAAIPDNLLESELFGHEKGAFTGAAGRRIGKFEEANNGTLLLDEISEMDIRLQAKLLRAIQEREIDRVGGSKPIKVDIRVIATSNRDLSQEVKRGTFRQDLLFRLNVVNIRIPPLRQRPQDIIPLAEHFQRKYADANGVAFKPYSPAALDLLRRHTWPGNVRELENAMHRAVLLSTGDHIEADAIISADFEQTQSGLADGQVAQAINKLGFGLPASGGAAAPLDAGDIAAADGIDGQQKTAMVGRTVADVERELIIDTLYHCLGNRTHAANILGISIRTLRNKLKQYTDDGVRVPVPGETRAVGC